MKKVKSILTSICFIFSFVSFSQMKDKTYLGVSYTIETNTGFHGFMFSLEEELKLRNKISFIAEGNFFTSNRIPDRKVGENQFNRSFVGDLGVQFNAKSLEKGFFANLGPTFRYSRTRQVSSYRMNLNGGEPYDIQYIRTESHNYGLKLGLGYKFPITEKINSGVFLNIRVIDVVPEPTFLSLGYKIGF